MDATTETTSIERQLSIAATVETVWEFLVDPDKLTRWMGLSATRGPRRRSLSLRCDHFLPRLEIAAGGGDPGEDPWLTQDMQAES
jgi:hypothetical protein